MKEQERDNAPWHDIIAIRTYLDTTKALDRGEVVDDAARLRALPDDRDPDSMRNRLLRLVEART